MRGVKSKDNCYLWESENTNYSSVCSIAKEEKEVKQWHQKLGHLHLRGMKKDHIHGGSQRDSKASN